MNIRNSKGFYRMSLISIGVSLAIIGISHIIEVQRMTTKIEAGPMKTICIGRFLLDVPIDSVVTYGRGTVTGWDFSAVADEDDAAFQLRLEKKEANLRAARNCRGGQSLEAIREVRVGNQRGRIFVYNKVWLDVIKSNPRRYDEIVSIDALVHLNTVTYEFKGKVHKEQDVKVLEDILPHLQYRKNEEVPDEEGFCFDRGMLAGNLGVDYHENTVAFIGLNEHPDLAIALSTVAGTDPGKTFLQRDAENSVKLENRWRFKVLREGRRDLNGIPGEEMLERVSEPNGSKLQGFMWESLTSRSDVYLPSLSLELNTGHGRPGEPIDSSLSDAEALALWDKISLSLRRRPFGASKKEASSENPVAANNVSAPKPCPVSGIWKCADGGEDVRVEGGSQRHFKAGTSMPQAVLVRPASMMQKLRATQDRFSTEIPTVWTLVEADKPAPNTGPASEEN